MKKRTVTASALLVCALAMATAAAAAEDTDRARDLAATCANCHGTSGHAQTHSGIDPLAGEPKEKIIQRLQDFRAGRRAATVMRQIAKGYSDAQIELIAGYFAAQK